MNRPSQRGVTITLLLVVAALSGCDRKTEATYEGKTASQWLPDMTDQDVATRRHAALALAMIAPNTNTDIAGAIDAGMQGSDGVVRVDSAIASWRLSRDSRSLPLLMRVFSDKGATSEEQAVSAEAMGLMGGAAKDALPMLRAYDEKNGKLRDTAANMGSVGMVQVIDSVRLAISSIGDAAN